MAHSSFRSPEGADALDRDRPVSSRLVRDIRLQVARTPDSAGAEALILASERELREIESAETPLDRGLLTFALHNLAVAREALELRRRWSTPA